MGQRQISFSVKLNFILKCSLKGKNIDKMLMDLLKVVYSVLNPWHTVSWLNENRTGALILLLKSFIEMQSDTCLLTYILQQKNIFRFLKVLINIFFCRHGDNGHYLFFSTTALKLSNTDTNIDVENLGNSTLVTFLLIPLVLILGYVIDGREYVQQSILEVTSEFIKQWI